MFNIIIDTREQTPLEFTSSQIDNIIRTKLDTGDYSIEGLEDKLCIERKSVVSEFYQNVTSKRFWSEMERMRKYPYRFIVMEFSASDVEMFPFGSGLSKSIIAKLRVPASYLMKCITRLQVEFGIHVVFAGSRDNASHIISNIMKEVYGQTSKT